MKKIFYNLVAITFSAYNKFFFKKLTVVGKEKIPTDGAIIFSPNHQSALLDPILVGVTCGKKLYYLTRSDVFRKPYLWLLDAMQTLPVYRIRDGFKNLHRNQKTFKKCYDLLKVKKSLLIFPEGKHHDKYYLQPISKGSSRIGLESLKRSQNKKIYLLPVGINYGNKIHPYHNCTVVYGKPIKLNDFFNAYQKKPADTLNRVRIKLEIEMKKCLWLPNRCDDYFTKKKMINYKTTKKKFEILKNKIFENDLDLVTKKNKIFFEKATISFFSFFNLIPLVLLSFILKKIKDSVFHLSIKYLFGLLIFPLWWAISFFILIYYFDIYFSLIILGSLVLSLYARQFIIIINK